jgi:uncharacterized Zn finger protein (UPF0148 family)
VAVAAGTAAEVRQCARCGAPLSRYNAEPTCASCNQAGEPAHAPGEWLSRPTAEAPTDDAGSVLRGWRASTGRSQAEVARLLGMTQQNLSLIENGKQQISFEQ